MNLSIQKKQKHNARRVLLIGSMVGVVIGIGATLAFNYFYHGAIASKLDSAGVKAQTQAQNKAAEPLYWVAPMDANYRRDKPGKSPMGMDLIPYYASEQQSEINNIGAIKISAAVENNLGVRTTKASYQDISQEISTVGYVTYNEDKLIHIHPRISGWIEKLYVNSIGDRVTKNQSLYDIYSPELVNAQEEYLLALNSNNPRLVTAAENRLLALKIPLATVSALRKSKQVKQYVTFYAPQSGVIDNLTVRAGYYVKPETMMLSIVDLSQVWVKAELFEQDLTSVAIGDDANMTLSSEPEKQWQGKVKHIHPMVNQATRTGVVRFNFDNSYAILKPNMHTKITINSASNKSALVIPKQALIRTGRQNRVVLALGEGRYKSITVKVGQFDNHYVEIIDGIVLGDEVVTSAQFLLDSESSKTSDFMRMQTLTTNGDEAQADKVSSATVQGIVKGITVNHRMVTIEREAIKKWARSAATVDFIVAKNLDMSLFKLNAQLVFTFEVIDGEFIIVSVEAKQ